MSEKIVFVIKIDRKEESPYIIQKIKAKLVELKEMGYSIIAWNID
jgi:hypothetical protein